VKGKGSHSRHDFARLVYDGYRLHDCFAVAAFNVEIGWRRRVSKQTPDGKHSPEISSFRQDQARKLSSPREFASSFASI